MHTTENATYDVFMTSPYIRMYFQYNFFQQFFYCLIKRNKISTIPNLFQFYFFDNQKNVCGQYNKQAIMSLIVEATRNVNNVSMRKILTFFGLKNNKN